jgi:hypothetical protein
MYESPADFVFSVTRDFVRGCQTPLLVLPGDDPPHPHAIGIELGSLAPRAIIHDPWKAPELIPGTVRAIRTFLKENTASSTAH